MIFISYHSIEIFSFTVLQNYIYFLTWSSKQHLWKKERICDLLMFDQLFHKWITLTKEFAYIILLLTYLLIKLCKINNYKLFRKRKERDISTHFLYQRGKTTKNPVPIKRISCFPFFVLCDMH